MGLPSGVSILKQGFGCLAGGVKDVPRLTCFFVMDLVGTPPTQTYTHKLMFNYANDHLIHSQDGWKHPRVSRTIVHGHGDVRRRPGIKMSHHA